MVVLLAMSTGFLLASGEGCARVTVEKLAGWESTYIYFNRVFAAICDPKVGSESAWPAVGFQGWSLDVNENVRLFFLVYPLAGCDFLPTTSGLGFEEMWECALKSTRAEDVFDSRIFFQNDGVWDVNIEECAKLLAAIFCFKFEHFFKDVCESPGELLQTLKGNVEE